MKIEEDLKKSIGRLAKQLAEKECSMHSLNFPPACEREIYFEQRKGNTLYADYDITVSDLVEWGWDTEDFKSLLFRLRETGFDEFGSSYPLSYKEAKK